MRVNYAACVMGSGDSPYRGYRACGAYLRLLWEEHRQRRLAETINIRWACVRRVLTEECCARVNDDIDQFIELALCIVVAATRSVPFF